MLVSRQGQVVASIAPASAADLALLVQFAINGGTEEDTLSARAVNQGSPSAFVNRAAAGERLLVTRDNKALGVLQPYSADDEIDRLRAREVALTEFERLHPEASQAEHVAFEDSLDAAPEPARDEMFVVWNTERTSTLAHITHELRGSTVHAGWGHIPPTAKAAIRRLMPPKTRPSAKKIWEKHSVVEVNPFRPQLKIGATDQLIARSLWRPAALLEVAGKEKLDRFAEVVEVGSKFAVSGSGRVKLVEKGDKIRYKSGGAVEVEFGGDELLILSKSAVVEVVED